MATDQTKLEGETSKSPEGDERDVMALLAGMLKALLSEQNPQKEPHERSP